ncbi:FAD-binding molybdopterin dehydrogenase [Prauserella marina]|uniref:Xanthine dehydrogenase YagS FAD-binding subunit n=1 Tax=Prauserella marina TaxID=530584 RepID=A0A222VZW4_9PSEU|nr:FAD-binding molybdopterin dehydrogenase [Prauserella marina]PWV80181.1 xanthine dehydrogenase YagS FAD-binding subunit [Prauserella marina]SDD48977.1 xanthine dehydrogenase YagS FAD-binding subunit [Prauserella marina]
METFHLDRPRSVAEAVRILHREKDATVIAGGTDLVTLLRDGVATPHRLVDVSLLGLDRIEWRRDGGVRIGALYSNAVADSRLAREYPVVTEALRAGASAQIRGMATLGGNISQRTRCRYFRLPEFACNKRAPGSGCSAIEGDGSGQAIFGTSSSCTAVHPSDLAVALRAVDAVVIAQSQRGSREIPMDEFHLLPGDTPHRETTLRPGELITAIELPARAHSGHSHYLKFRDRASFAFALVSAAVALDIRGGAVRTARVALGGVAPAPWRAVAAERVLTGKRPTAEVIDAAAKAATEGARPGKDNEHKVELVRRVVRRALTELGQR